MYSQTLLFHSCAPFIEQLSMYTAAMFEEMPFMEKHMWNARAEDDRQRYVHDLKHYTPSPGYDSKGNRLADSLDSKGPSSPTSNSSICTSTSPSSRKGMARKDARFPKRFLSAFLMYQKSLRQELKDNPGITFGHISQHSSDMFKKMDEQEKSEWVRKAQQDKKRYERELADYVPSKGYDHNGNFIDENTKKKRTRAIKDVNSPKRAAGAFVFFSNEMRPKLQKENPGVKFVDIGRILGERWRALGEKEKEPFDSLSAKDKARYRREMDAYKERKQEEESNKEEEEESRDEKEEDENFEPIPIYSSRGSCSMWFMGDSVSSLMTELSQS